MYDMIIYGTGGADNIVTSSKILALIGQVTLLVRHDTLLVRHDKLCCRHGSCHVNIIWDMSSVCNISRLCFN